MELESQKEIIALAMLQTKGNLTLTSRLPQVNMNDQDTTNY